MTKPQYLISIVGWCILAMFMSYDSYTQDNNRNLQIIEVVKVTKQQVQEKLHLRGKIQSIKSVRVFPDRIQSGIIEKKKISKGDYVNKDDVLMYINQSSVSAEKYRLSPVKAKISGIVSAIFVENGDKVSTQDALCQIIQINKLKAVISVPAKKMQFVKKGNRIRLSFKEYPKKSILTRIDYISATMHPQLPIIHVEGRFNNSNLQIKPGLDTQVELFISTKKVILIPLKSVLFENNIAHIFIYNKSTKRVKMQTVKLGEGYGENIEVLDGIHINELIVIKGKNRILDNEEVLLLNQKS